MEVRRLDVSLLCAEDLSDGSFLGKVRAFAVAWLDPSSPQQSQVSVHGSHTSPVWIDQSFSFPAVPDSSFLHRAAHLTLQIFHRSALVLPTGRRKALLGTARVPLSPLLEQGTGTLTLMWCDVVRPSSGSVQGRVKVGVRVGPKEVRSDVTNEAVMAYPAFDDYIGASPRFQCYPHSRRRLTRGLPAVPYFAPATSSGACGFACRDCSIPDVPAGDGDGDGDGGGAASSDDGDGDGGATSDDDDGDASDDKDVVFDDGDDDLLASR